MAKRALRKESKERAQVTEQSEEPTGPAERDEDVVRMEPDDMPSSGQERQVEERTAERRPAKQDDGLVEITIGGKKRRVDPEMAEILQAQASDFETRLADVRRSLPAASATQERQERKPEPDFFDRLGIEKVEEAIFTDPKRVLKRVYDLATEDTTKRMTGAYNQDQQFKQFMEDFYDENQDLRGLKDVVMTVLNSNVSDLTPLPPRESRKRLSELVREHVAGIVRRAAPEQEETETEEDRGGERRETTRVERPSGERQAQPRSERVRTEEQEGPSSITKLLQQRRRARQAARTATR